MSTSEERHHLLIQTSSPTSINSDNHNTGVVEESSLLLAPPQHRDNSHNDATVISSDQRSNRSCDINTGVIMNGEPSLISSSPSSSAPNKILLNFILFSILFSTNHGAVVSCLSLATARLGNLGTTQNSCLYLSYTLSALFGSTYVIKTIGSYYSIIVGMFIYCIYVLSYVIATIVDGNEYWGWLRGVAIIGGGLIGGIGGGFLWTAQGSYFAKQAEEYGVLKHRLSGVARRSGNDDQADHAANNEQQQAKISEATSLFAGIFACIYLLVEVIMRLSSSFMIQALNLTWSIVFAGYAIVAISATLAMIFFVQNNVHSTEESGISSVALAADEGNYVAPSYPNGSVQGSATTNQQSNHEQQQDDVFVQHAPVEDSIQQQPQSDLEDDKESTFYKATITFRMLFLDPKMKYMIPMCAVFGLSAVFIITFVNGEVLRISLNDDKSVYIGILSSITSATAGILSFVFGFVSQRLGNGIILFIGCAAFFMVAFLFIVIPDLKQWNVPLLVVVYALQGVGRSTFEGALKAEFAIVFTEKEGAVSLALMLNVWNDHDVISHCAVSVFVLLFVSDSLATSSSKMV